MKCCKSQIQLDATTACIVLNCIFLPKGNYRLQLYDPRTNGFAPSSPEIGMHVEIRDPEDKIILSKVYSSEGRWTFTSHTPGEHVICLYTNSSKWFSGTQLVSVAENLIDITMLISFEAPNFPLIN